MTHYGLDHRHKSFLLACEMCLAKGFQHLPSSMVGLSFNSHPLPLSQASGSLLVQLPMWLHLLADAQNYATVWINKFGFSTYWLLAPSDSEGLHLIIIHGFTVSVGFNSQQLNVRHGGNGQGSRECMRTQQFTIPAIKIHYSQQPWQEFAIGI